MKLSFELLNKLNQQRIVQLIFKTNQFNTRTCRYNEKELIKLRSTGSIWGIRIKDRLGSDEIIGVLIVQPKDKQLVIDNFLLSCRVLGRGVDVAVLYWCVTFALKNGYDFVLAEIIRTERNKPVHDVYTKNGFKSIGNNMYQIDTNTNVLKMPGWIEIIENV